MLTCSLCGETARMQAKPDLRRVLRYIGCLSACSLLVHIDAASAQQIDLMCWSLCQNRSTHPMRLMLYTHTGRCGAGDMGHPSGNRNGSESSFVVENVLHRRGARCFLIRTDRYTQLGDRS